MPAKSSEAPDFFTVEEAARVLRIGRTAAYALARTWRDTNGREGLPVVEFGRLLRVPRAKLEQIAGGPITAAAAMNAERAATDIPPTAASPPEPPRAPTRSRRAARTASDQPALPLA